ncbi:hypothetical protein M409DRAFT_52055 [Zasmidium cellare ATCC 36951]|uniref:Transcription factor domain-containing protein n=1 Tax=Zasmidium cellare ATCC 36951 TaxID=1080233 RepID=A0A6A6CR02_ZASCE|nr:uncharacterized protein M409DRAFT_52055 [Zasmidium cellare ATCC 36951]KAF2169515.1 hypothetical protein M409DRAFT_52055 [Zasmidium cellare ATCC 36951]
MCIIVTASCWPTITSPRDSAPLLGLEPSKNDLWRGAGGARSDFRPGTGITGWRFHIESSRTREAPNSPGSLSTLSTEEDQDGQPIHQVSARPWTAITTSDEAVSHLVSLFLAWMNPTWRFVEQDIFLRGMRSKQLDSDFCSSFLVNSICAIASVRRDVTFHGSWRRMLTQHKLQSEHEVAFSGEGRDRITRGRHFHDEALRLWALEEYRPSLTNIQALCILSLKSNYRAKDRLGLTLIPIAVQLNNELPLNEYQRRYVDNDFYRRDFAVARLSTHWTAKCTHIIMRLAFMSPATVTANVSGLPKIREVYDDRSEPWIGYPFTTDAVAYRPTMYLVERCRLAELFQEMHDLIFTQRRMSIREFATALDQLSSRVQQWYQHLPFELHYEWPMSIYIWELHASYLTSLMILWCAAKTKFEQRQETSDYPQSSTGTTGGDDHDDAHFRSQMAQKRLSSSILLAHKAAEMLRDFRERYGLKVTPAWLLQLQAVTAGVLLQDPELADPTIISSPEVNASDRSIRNSHAAFDEVFRCLLGTGVEVMIARGIARMMYHTALDR